MSDTPLPIIDAHHHLWDLSVCHYPWLMARGEKRFFGDPTPIQKNYLPQDLRQDARGFNIVNSVHIQVGVAEGDEVAETQWLQSCADRDGMPSAIIAFCDLTQDNRDTILDAHQQNVNLRGIRQIVSRSAEEDGKTGTAALLESAAFANGLNRLAERNLSFDLQLTPPVLPQAAAMFCRQSATPLALCHAGSLQDFSPEGVAQWRDGLTALAKHDNVLCKISGFGMFSHDWQVDDIRDYVLQAIDIFGPQRIAFGSNFPVDGLHAVYGKVMGAYLQITDDFSDDERRAMFHDNAARFYRLD